MCDHVKNCCRIKHRRFCVKYVTAPPLIGGVIYYKIIVVRLLKKNVQLLSNTKSALSRSEKGHSQINPHNTTPLDLKVDQANICWYSQTFQKYSLQYSTHVIYKKNGSILKDFIELVFVFKRTDSKRIPFKINDT